MRGRGRDRRPSDWRAISITSWRPMRAARSSNTPRPTRELAIASPRRKQAAWRTRRSISSRPPRRITEERYQTIEFPFSEFAAPNFVIEQVVTLDDVAGYIRTWSATRAYVKHHGEDPVDGLVNQLAPAWGVPQQSRLARWPVTMRVGRVS